MIVSLYTYIPYIGNMGTFIVIGPFSVQVKGFGCSQKCSQKFPVGNVEKKPFVFKESVHSPS